jgi:hypothetical protein
VRRPSLNLPAFVTKWMLKPARLKSLMSGIGCRVTRPPVVISREQGGVISVTEQLEHARPVHFATAHGYGGRVLAVGSQRVSSVRGCETVVRGARRRRALRVWRAV